MKMTKAYKLTKFIVYVVLGILVLMFNQTIMSNEGAIINGVVGSVIALYGIEGIILPIATKQVKKERIEMLNGGVNLLIAIIMIFLLEGNAAELRIVCVMWSLWSIMREGEEIVEKGFVGIKKHPIVSAINFAESIVVIIFSIMLICAKNPEELLEHAHVHVILLGIELIIEVMWIYAAELEARGWRKLKRRHAKEEQEVNE